MDDQQNRVFPCEPLVEAHVDLRAIAPYMPLDVVRFRDCDFIAQENAAGVVAGLLLWAAAWHQVPAGSLPDDEIVLARYAGYRHNLDAFRSLRSTSMHGFVLCSDGRWYHPVICDKALEVWTRVQSQRRRTKNATAARTGKKPSPGNDVNRNDKRPPQRDARRDGHRDVDVAAHQGEERKGEERIDSKNPPIASTAAAAPRVGLDSPSAEDEDWGQTRQLITDAFERANSPATPNTNWVETWRASGYLPSLCATVVTGMIAKGRKPNNGSLKFFDGVLAEEHAKMRKSQLAAGTPAKVGTIDWDHIVKTWVATGEQVWLAPQSPRPGSGGCLAPREILSRHMPVAYPPLQS